MLCSLTRKKYCLLPLLHSVLHMHVHTHTSGTEPHSEVLRMQNLKTPSVENPELKDSPFKAWSRSGYSHACFTCCQGFLPLTNFYLLGPFILIFVQNLSRVFPVLAVANAGSCVDLQNKTGCPARHHR